MVAASVHRITVWEDNGFSLMDRLIGNDATDLTQAAVTSIAWSIYDLADATVAFATGTLTVATVVFNSLQTDARWTTDSTGYNFRWDVPATTLTGGDRVYKFEIKFTMTSGEPFHDVWEVTTKKIIRS